MGRPRAKPSFAKGPVGLSLVCDGSAAGAAEAARERGLSAGDPQGALAELLSNGLAEGIPSMPSRGSPRRSRALVTS
jgi:hypothetical protein